MVNDWVSRAVVNLRQNESTTRIFIFYFLIAFLARGQAVLGQFSIDDYMFVNELSSANNLNHLSQGRYMSALLGWLYDLFSISFVRTGWVSTILSLVTQVWLVMSVTKFLRVRNNRANAIFWGVFLCHPYLTEIYTFQIALIGSIVGNILLIMFFSVLQSKSESIKPVVVASFILIVLMMTYQIHINFIAVVCIFLAIYTYLGKIPFEVGFLRLKRLVVSSFVGLALYFLIVRLASGFIQVEAESRTRFIDFREIPARLSEVFVSDFAMILKPDEPIFGGASKVIFGTIFITCAVSILFKLLRKILAGSNRKFGIAVISAFSISLILLPGLIVFLGSWWPVPRVLSHVALFTTLMLIIVFQFNVRNWLKAGLAVVASALLTSGAFLSAQVFSDQGDINRFDETLAQEIAHEFNVLKAEGKVDDFFIIGKFWRHEVVIPSNQGDLNISAFMTDSSFGLLTRVTGKVYPRASAEHENDFRLECERKPIFPAEGSVFTSQRTGVVCLGD